MELSSHVDFLTLLLLEVLLLEAEGTCRNCLVILELPIGFDALISRLLLFLYRVTNIMAT
jgi:hypothetical protein